MKRLAYTLYLFFIVPPLAVLTLIPLDRYTNDKPEYMAHIVFYGFMTYVCIFISSSVTLLIEFMKRTA